MATASVVPLTVKTSLDSLQPHKEGASATILQFPRRQTTEEIIREWVVLDAKVHPDIFPGGLPRNLERDVQHWVQAFAFAPEVFARKWREDVATWKAMLAEGMTYVGPIDDPATEKRCAEYHAYFYGEPEEGHEAWLPWLAQQAEPQSSPPASGVVFNFRRESMSPA